jgi:hypothetical protein
MQFFRRLLARLFPGRFDRRAPRNSVVPLFLNAAASQPLTIHRDVSRNGVRVYSLCGSCGARLEASATLCDECAQRRSRSTPGF